MCTTKRTMPGRRVERRRIGDRSVDPVYALREKIGGDDRVVNWWEGGRNCCNIDVTTNIILALPGPAENVQVSDITATSVKLTWSYKDPDEVQYYVIQHKPKHVNQAFAEISGITTMYYHVRSLSPYTEYELYVIVVNAIGRGPPSAPVTVTTGETSQYFLFLLTPPPPTLYLRIFSFSHFIHWRTRARSSPKIFRMFSFERAFVVPSSRNTLRDIRRAFRITIERKLCDSIRTYLVTMKYRDEFT